MTHSTDIEISDDPWMSHAFISKLMTQVSLPYRKPKDGAKEIVRRNGNLTVKFTATGDCLPYGKYPRLFELWACTMVKSGNTCFNPETNVLNLGSTFRGFLKLLNIQVGGRQLRTIKPQLENLFKCVYSIDNSTANETRMRNFVVAPEAHIDWLSNDPQEDGLFENWVRFSPEYVDYLRDSPVPVDLSVVARLNSPLSLDIYWWLARRYSYLHERESITWEQLYSQFGSKSVMRSFKQTFMKAVREVQLAYPEARITCGPRYVTLYPSETSIPTTSQIHAVEKASSRASVASSSVEGHWITITGYGRVWWTSKEFDVNSSRNHLTGAVPMDQCLLCAFDERNREYHATVVED